MVYVISKTQSCKKLFHNLSNHQSIKLEHKYFLERSCIYVSTYIHTYPIYILTHKYILTYVQEHTYISMRMYFYIRTCIYVCILSYIHVHHTYIYIQKIDIKAYISIYIHVHACIELQKKCKVSN